MRGYYPAIDVLLDQRNWSQAEPLIRDLLRESPDDASLLSGLALCLLNTKRVRESRAVLGAALNADAEYAFTHYLCGHAARSGAEPLVRHAFESQRSFVRRHAKKAQPYFLEALRLEPENPQYCEAAADNALELGDTQAAIRLAQQGLRLYPEHTGCLNSLAAALSESGHLNDAQRTSLAALAANPDDAYTHANRGWLLLRTGAHEDALIHFRSSLRRHPGSIWARLGLKEATKRRFKPYGWIAGLLRWASGMDRTFRHQLKFMAIVLIPLVVLVTVVMFVLLIVEGRDSPDPLPAWAVLVSAGTCAVMGFGIPGVLLLALVPRLARGLQSWAEYTLLFSADGRLALTASERLRMTAWLLFWAWLVLLVLALFAQPWVWVRAVVMMFGLPAVGVLSGVLSSTWRNLTRAFWVANAMGLAMAGFITASALWASVGLYESLAVVWLLCMLGLPICTVVAVQRALPEVLRDDG